MGENCNVMIFDRFPHLRSVFHVSHGVLYSLVDTAWMIWFFWMLIVEMTNYLMSYSMHTFHTLCILNFGGYLGLQNGFQGWEIHLLISLSKLDLSSANSFEFWKTMEGSYWIVVTVEMVVNIQRCQLFLVCCPGHVLYSFLVLSSSVLCGGLALPSTALNVILFFCNLFSPASVQTLIFILFLFLSLALLWFLYSVWNIA